MVSHQNSFGALAKTDFSVVKPWAVAENSLNRLERNGVATITHKISPIRSVLLGWKISGIWDFGEIWSHWQWCWPRPVAGSKWDFAGLIHIKKKAPRLKLHFFGASSPFCPSTLTFQPLPRSCAKTAPKMAEKSRLSQWPPHWNVSFSQLTIAAWMKDDPFCCYRIGVSLYIMLFVLVSALIFLWLVTF